MSKQQKPVWRVNSGNGVPSDLGGKILYSNGLLTWSRAGHRYCNESWNHDTGIYIYAYKTTRTKAARYERVKCRHCLGVGGIGLHAFCPSCNGKGYTLEAIK